VGSSKRQVPFQSGFAIIGPRRPSQLTGKGLLNLPELHSSAVSREANGVELGERLEQLHHIGMVPMGSLCLMVNIVRHFILRNGPGPRVMHGHREEVLCRRHFAPSPDLV
jgi:hypothetical protein